jgi:hypothetical protein
MISKYDCEYDFQKSKDIKSARTNKAFIAFCSCRADFISLLEAA